MKLSLKIDGMGCGGCVKTVKGVLAAVPGVTVEDVKVGAAVVLVDPARATAETIAGKLADAGYTVVGTEQDGASRAELAHG